MDSSISGVVHLRIEIHILKADDISRQRVKGEFHFQKSCFDCGIPLSYCHRSMCTRTKNNRKLTITFEAPTTCLYVRGRGVGYSIFSADNFFFLKHKKHQHLNLNSQTP